MSGTSLDGLDACLAEYRADRSLDVIKTDSRPLASSLRERMETFLVNPKAQQLSDLLSIESEYTDAVIAQCLDLMQQSPGPIDCIGFHGQTLWHAPELGNTLQIGMAERLAEATGSVVAHQFRRSDMARGGQGAPLAPLFHAAQFARETEGVAVINLGGIANVTELIPGQPTQGYDLGPANTLLDQWYQAHHSGQYDSGGAWAQTGTVDGGLLASLKSDPFFRLPAPKSTGREYFNLNWLRTHLTAHANLAPADIQATLSQLTAELVHESLTESVDILVVAGGGVHNSDLMDRIDDLVDPLVVTSDTFGIDPDHVESACFAWLGMQARDQVALETQTITGAQRIGVLGSLVTPSARD